MMIIACSAILAASSSRRFRHEEIISSVLIRISLSFTSSDVVPAVVVVVFTQKLMSRGVIRMEDEEGEEEAEE